MIIDKHMAIKLETMDAFHSSQYAKQYPLLDVSVKTAVRDIGDGLAVFAGDDMPMNRVLGLGLKQPVNQLIFDEIENFYAQFNTIPQIDFCPHADPLLMNMLRVRGYMPLKMYSVLVQKLPHECKEIRTAAKLDISFDTDRHTWIETVNQGFLGVEVLPPQGFGKPYSELAYDRDDTLCALATINGVPVGAGAMSIHDNGCMLFSASTRKQYRRQGVQSALMQARMDYAEQQGCQFVMVMATPSSDSERNIQRLGFQIAYTKLVFALP